MSQPPGSADLGAAQLAGTPSGNADVSVAGNRRPTTSAEIPTVADGVCECGDYRSQHVMERGNCRVCRFGTAPPDGADGCQRYREAGRTVRRVFG